MTLLDKLKGLFTRDEIPDEAKRIFDRAQTAQELLRGLDHLLTQNEVEARELTDELTKLERLAQMEEEKVRAGALPDRHKQSALRYIKRLRLQMDNYEGRLRIYERNMNLHLTLIGKIQQMEAMKLRGVDESRIDEILMEFEEKLEKWNDVIAAAEGHERVSTATAREEKELRDLEAEILGGERPAGREPARKPPERERERAAPAPAPERRPPIEEIVSAREPRAPEAIEREEKRVELE